MPRQPLQLLIPLLITGCAYGYAGQEGKNSPEREVKPSVTVVEIEEKEEEESEKETEAEQADEESPCGAPSFDIFYFTDSSRVTKTIDCTERTVTNVERTPMGETTYVDAKAAGLPEGVWYLLVDPKGVRSNFLNNAQLLQLSREFDIEYFGRDASRDLLVYLYQDEVD